MEHDNVINPAHYDLELPENAQAIDVVRAVLGPEKFAGFCRGNALKYLIRADRKNGLEDLKKAMVYLKWEVDTRTDPEPEEAEPAQAAEPAKKGRPKKEETKPTKRKPVDHGKIMALHRAGWSVAKIADEMRVSDQTVRNHIQQEAEA